MDTTTTTETDHETEALLARLDEIWRGLDGQLVLSQARYVDELLDCLTTTDRHAVRAVVCDVLAEVSGLSSVATTRVREHVALLSAAALLD
jgi:hypothetical protein